MYKYSTETWLDHIKVLMVYHWQCSTYKGGAMAESLPSDAIKLTGEFRDCENLREMQQEHPETI